LSAPARIEDGEMVLPGAIEGTVGITMRRISKNVYSFARVRYNRIPACFGSAPSSRT
jgi:hypothetical protein